MVNKKQLKILIEEKAKPVHERLSWVKISKLLNGEGPCIKNAFKWQMVNMEHNYQFYLVMYLSYIVVF